MIQIKKCHWCKKELSRSLENLFQHCFECGLKRLEKLKLAFEPCPVCKKFGVKHEL